MKKTLKAAVALSVLAAPAYAANLENPLYMPKQGAVYSKTSVGVMYKKADHSAAQQQLPLHLAQAISLLSGRLLPLTQNTHPQFPAQLPSLQHLL